MNGAMTMAISSFWKQEQTGGTPPDNNYVTEDGSQDYVTEDGMQPYVPES